MVFSPPEFRPFQLEKGAPGLSVTSCVVYRSSITNKEGKTEEIIRPCTPTSVEKAQGHIGFVIKDYPQGVMSSHVHSLNVGETIDIKGPFEKYNSGKKPLQQVSIVAGGTGITPTLQLLHFSIHLDFGNTTEQDILLKGELDGYGKQYPDRFKVYFVLEKSSEGWNGYTGYVTLDLVKDALPKPDVESSIIFVCGPPPLMEDVSGDKNPDKSQGTLRGFLKTLGYIQDRVYKL